MKLLKLYTQKIFDIFKANWKNFLIIGVIYLLIFAAFSPLSVNFDNQLTHQLELLDNTKISMNLIRWLMIGIIGIFVTSVIVTSIHNFFIFVLSKSFSINNFNILNVLKQNFKSFWKVALFSLIEVLIITFGIIFFIVPGIYCLFIFSFALPIMANENLSIVSSIKKAQRILNQNLWKNIGLILLLKLIVLLGLIVASLIKINGLITLIDWFVTTALIYLIIYEPINIEKNQPELKTENE
jgi:uncharacterized membrane protein